jgi:monoamine oxidase
LGELSCLDQARELRVSHAGAQDSRIREGYGALLHWYSRDLPIRLRTPVQTIRWGADGVTVTAGAEVFRARQCILTVPVSILQRELIRFEPPLSAEKQRALATLRMEPATKLIYRFRERLWDEELTYLAHAGTVARWWTPGYGRPEATVLSAYVTAGRAHTIDALEESHALAVGLNELSGLLDVPETELRRSCVASRRVSWAMDPWSLGGYALVPPGAAEARVVLARPEGDVLFFAGEATAHDSNPQTVHGALESGWRAARECGL